MCAVAVVASLLVDVPEAAQVVVGDRAEAWGELISDLLVVALAVVGTAGVLHIAGRIYEWYGRPRRRPLSAAGLRFQELAGDIRSVMYSTQRPDEFGHSWNLWSCHGNSKTSASPVHLTGTVRSGARSRLNCCRERRQVTFGEQGNCLPKSTRRRENPVRQMHNHL